MVAGAMELNPFLKRSVLKKLHSIEPSRFPRWAEPWGRVWKRMWRFPCCVVLDDGTVHERAYLIDVTDGGWAPRLGSEVSGFWASAVVDVKPSPHRIPAKVAKAMDAKAKRWGATPGYHVQFSDGVRYNWLPDFRDGTYDDSCNIDFPILPPGYTPEDIDRIELAVGGWFDYGHLKHQSAMLCEFVAEGTDLAGLKQMWMSKEEHEAWVKEFYSDLFDT